jgi:hypothetical protein
MKRMWPGSRDDASEARQYLRGASCVRREPRSEADVYETARYLCPYRITRGSRR